MATENKRKDNSKRKTLRFYYCYVCAWYINSYLPWYFEYAWFASSCFGETHFGERITPEERLLLIWYRCMIERERGGERKHSEIKMPCIHTYIIASVFWYYRKTCIQIRLKMNQSLHFLISFSEQTRDEKPKRSKYSASNQFSKSCFFVCSWCVCALRFALF